MVFFEDNCKQYNYKNYNKTNTTNEKKIAKNSENKFDEITPSHQSVSIQTGFSTPSLKCSKPKRPIYDISEEEEDDEGYRFK